MSIIRAFSVSYDGGTWSPFNEPLFASAAYSMLKTSPETMAQLLCLEGVTQHLWRTLSLPEATSPPRAHRPYTRLEVSELFEALEEIANGTQEDINSRPTKSPSGYSLGSVSTSRRSSLSRMVPVGNFGRRHGRKLPPSPLSVSQPVEVFPRACDPFQADSPWNKSIQPSPRAFVVDGDLSLIGTGSSNLGTEIQRSVSNLSELQLPAAEDEESSVSLPDLRLSKVEKGRSGDRNVSIGRGCSENFRKASSPGVDRPRSLLELVMSTRQTSSNESLRADCHSSARSCRENGSSAAEEDSRTANRNEP